MQALRPILMKFHFAFPRAVSVQIAAHQALALLVLGIVSGAALAQSGSAANSPTRIYRCGNAYTNDATEAQAKGCKLLEGGNVTVVQGTRVQPAPSLAPTAPRAAGSGAGPVGGTGGAGGARVDSPEQRARDSDARFILESELKKAEARRAELLKEYNNGEPEKLGAEVRNHQKYLDRVAELKAAIARADADIAGLQRELSRLSASK